MFPGMMDPDNVGAPFSVLTTTASASLPGFCDIFPVEPTPVTSCMVQDSEPKEGLFFPQQAHFNEPQQQQVISQDPGGEPLGSKDGLIAELLWSSEDSPNLRQALVTDKGFTATQNVQNIQEGEHVLTNLLSPRDSEQISFQETTSYEACMQQTQQSSVRTSILENWSSSGILQDVYSATSTPSTTDNKNNLDFDYGVAMTSTSCSMSAVMPSAMQTESSVKQGLQYHIHTKRLATGSGPIYMDTLHHDDVFPEVRTILYI